MKRMSVILAMLVCSIRAASASPVLGLPEPVATPPREVREEGPSPLYYRLPPNVVTRLTRSAIGGHTRWSGEGDTSFTFDVLAGAAIRFGRDADLGLWIEGGYSYVRGHEHLAMLGIGPARWPTGVFGSTFALEPHVVAGTIDGASGVGLRTSAIAGFGRCAIELAHQVVAIGPARIHEMHLALTFPFTPGPY